jgi:hypothetical protein
MTDTRHPRRPVRLAATGAIVVAAASMLAIPAASGAGKAKWVTISTGNVNNTGTTPSIARFGHGYEVVWVKKTGLTSFQIDARMLNAAGKPVGGVITVISKWFGIENDPTILADGKERIVAFAGDKEGKPSNYDNDTEYYLTSTDGTHWTLSTGSLSAAGLADRDDGTAVINDGGTLITGMAAQDGVVYHVGASATNPAPGTDPLTATTGNFSYSPGLGVDRKTHKVWALWYSNSGKNGQDGVNAQIIYPSLGTRLNAPGSSNPVTKSFGVQEDLSAASRVGGGVYTAYVTPKVQSIDVWKVGAKKPFATIKDHNLPGAVSLTSAPHGRLWLYWRDRNGWRAARSNKAATKFGRSIGLPIVPKSAIQNIYIAANGSAGPLEAIATQTTASNVNELIARQVLARLSVKASPHSVKRGHTFTVKVTDVGDAVKGATVHFDGLKKKTNKKGKARFKVPGSASLGKHSVTFTMSGYTAASTKITIVS